MKTALLLLLLSLPLLHACSCPFTPFTTHYCESTLALTAKVLAKTHSCRGECSALAEQIEGHVTYILQANATFKGEAPKDGVMYVTTAVNGALCGVELAVGQVYFLALGERRTGVCPTEYWPVGLCDFVQAWGEMKEGESAFVLGSVDGAEDGCVGVPTMEAEGVEGGQVGPQVQLTVMGGEELV